MRLILFIPVILVSGIWIGVHFRILTYSAQLGKFSSIGVGKNGWTMISIQKDVGNPEFGFNVNSTDYTDPKISQSRPKLLKTMMGSPPLFEIERNPFHGQRVPTLTLPIWIIWIVTITIPLVILYMCRIERNKFAEQGVDPNA